MPLSNYQSRSPMPNIFADIQKTLVEHGAKQVVFDYGDVGKIVGITFTIETQAGPMTIRLPAMFDRVQAIFDKQGLRYKPDQPYRTAWATLRDWVKAQMALIDWQMVKLEQVFLPYAVGRDGRTYFEILQSRGFLLEAGDGTQSG